MSNLIFKPIKIGNSIRLLNTDGADVGTLGIGTGHRTKAFEEGLVFVQETNKAGKTVYKKYPAAVYNNLVSTLNTEEAATVTESETASTHSEVVSFIHNKAVELKPDNLVMKDLSWKYLIRSAIRAKNIMMTGPSGCGKTFAAKALVRALDRPDFYFNLGSTQDPRATLIGNTQFNKEAGTFFSESAFVKAIKTPNSVILLDELSRAHPDAWNILMTVLDQGQRYLRLDEAEGSPIVNVAEGVTFIATANIGSEYTSTRVMDRAILDRFTIIEMEVLSKDEEFGLLTKMFPEVNSNTLQSIAEIASHTRTQSKLDDGKLTNSISTRASVEMASLIWDGFSLLEAAEISIIPYFSADGGIDSERTYIRQYIQKFNGGDTIEETTNETETEAEMPF
jgi:nitric oxide reductase NorQ protein